MLNYWLVGASWGGSDHQDETFINNGYWMLGWEEDDQPAQYKKAAQMKAGDRIAIKRMKGRGHSDIKIFHIGIIKGVILESNNITCTVNWIVTNVNRDVESRGAFKSIHGPFEKDDWIEKIFCL